jgi:hypothetical protein
VALSTPGQQWLVEALVGAGSTVVALQVAVSTVEAAVSVAVVTDAETA